eukprot:CAMPEP_0197252690 /NCGR_PEP_ID=MMETSP1429-20130617/62332_1 /TAXON_ID=49237 /ORGANISM="Chaetoceros  sp., Strain UNC1202" /LENGTH=196 /DNA_ID=CAMNT_0042715139 /DNA_START=80 /DNA_END=670 /DNA_ORIENTATION=+
MTTTGAPTALSIDRIETLSETHFNDARQISNEFLSTTNKRACLICPCGLCPDTKEEFEGFYRRSPGRCSTHGLAVRSDGVVVGVVNLRQGGQDTKFFETLMHRPGPQEVYVEYMAVTKDARGMGAGTKMLEWAEAVARERDATTLTLSVVNGNPAKRLYERKGFKDVAKVSAPEIFCLFGMPHGQCGGTTMEKELV